MDYRKKYLKYKYKYGQLKKLKNVQRGGAKFNVIPNTGSEDGMTNQCMWISIRDYLLRYLGMRISVRDIRKMAELDKTSEHEQFDWESRRFQFRRAIEIIARKFNLRINLYLTDHNGNPNEHLLYPGSDIPIPMHIINDHGVNIVNIAFYGAHFELIVNGPGIAYNLPVKVKEQKVDVIKPITFFNNQIVEGRMKQYIDIIIENNQTLELLEKDIKKILEQIEQINRNITELKSDEDSKMIRDLGEKDKQNLNLQIVQLNEIMDGCRKTIKDTMKKI